MNTDVAIRKRDGGHIYKSIDGGVTVATEGSRGCCCFLIFFLLLYSTPAHFVTVTARTRIPQAVSCCFLLEICCQRRCACGAT